MKNKTLGILALAVVGVFALSFVAAMPFTSNEDHDAIKEAIENGDYGAWKSLMEAQLTEDNFEKMTQMHELKESIRSARESGDMEEAKALMEDLRELMPEDRGFGKGKMGFGKGVGNGQGMRNQEGCPFAE